MNLKIWDSELASIPQSYFLLAVVAILMLLHFAQIQFRSATACGCLV